MAKRTSASKRAFTKLSPVLKMGIFGFILFSTGLVSGYAVRSYSPLSIFPDERLSPTDGEKSKTDEKIEVLEDTLKELDTIRAKAETELGETKIKAILEKN